VKNCTYKRKAARSIDSHVYTSVRQLHTSSAIDIFKLHSLNGRLLLITQHAVLDHRKALNDRIPSHTRTVVRECCNGDEAS